MKRRFTYETPVLVDLSVESAVGATCGMGNDAGDWMCAEGSCPPSCQCYTGSYAQWCTSGVQAHHTTDENCLSCCSTGTGVSAPSYGCNCNAGYGAVMNCTYGGNSTQDCAGGGNYGYCM